MAVAKKKDKNKKKKHKPATKLILLEGGAAVAKRRQAAVEAAAAVAPSSTKGRNDGKLTLTGVRSKDTWAHVNERRIIFFRMGEDDVDVEFLAVVTDVENQKTTVRKNCEETTISNTRRCNESCRRRCLLRLSRRRRRQHCNGRWPPPPAESHVT